MGLSKSISASILCTGLLASPALFAQTIVPSTASAISAVLVYTSSGGGDVVFTLQTNSIAACPRGYWIRASDPGARNAVAQVLAAYHAGKPVTVYADTATIWTGSASAACLVYLIVE
jgi:hypothetical protein